MAAPKGNRYNVRPGATGRSTKRHVIPVTEEEHARHHELARVQGRKLADLVRELLDARAAEVLGPPPPAAPAPRKRRSSQLR